MTDKDLNIDIDIDMKIYQLSKLSYVYRLHQQSKILREKISICYSKEEATKKAVEILRKWLKERENGTAAKI